MSKGTRAYVLGAPELFDSKGAAVFPYAAWYAGGTRAPTFQECERKHGTNGVPFWVNPHWLAQLDYIPSNSLLLLSLHAYEALKRCGEFPHRVLPAKLYAHPEWSSETAKPPWVKVPSVRGKKPLSEQAVVLHLPMFKVSGLRLTALGKFLAEDDDSPPMPSSVPPIFHVVGLSDEYVSALAKKSLTSEGIRFGYSDSILIPPTPARHSASGGSKRR